MTYTDTQQSSVIKAIEEPVITNYFLTINQENFLETAALFAENGELKAPFEQPITCRKAIASYLTKEAKGMQLLPQQATSEINKNNFKQIKVTGKVKTSLFRVNVAWHFCINQDGEIITVIIKLIASPQELLGLKQAKADLCP
ncbi:MAG: nuclear transport factor 2 family protein [Pleurocapsa sp.]